MYIKEVYFLAQNNRKQEVKKYQSNRKVDLPHQSFQHTIFCLLPQLRSS